MTKFNVGDRVRYRGNTGVIVVPEPDTAGYIITLHNGNYCFAAEETATLVPTYREQWINIYDGDSAGGYSSRDAADVNQSQSLPRIAVIHLADDGTVTLHKVDR